MVDLSVHLITYNNEKHINETIQSILKQKVNFNYEIVVGDDFSTDKTFEIIKQYKRKHPNLFNIKKNKTQLGILKNFKTTLDRCKGKYIFDIAGDDLFKHNYTLQKMFDVLKKDDSLGFVDSGFDLLIEKKNKIQPYHNKKTIEASKINYTNSILLGNFTPIGICFNKYLLYKYVDFKTYLNMNLSIEDYPILVDLIMHTNFKTIKESLHIYRTHENSHSHEKNFEELLFQKKQMKNLFNFFQKKYNFNKSMVKTYNNNYNQHLLFLAGYFQKKELGKKSMLKITNKDLKDYIHFYASQYKSLRKFISLIKN